jgi:hypothetical protein
MVGGGSANQAKRCSAAAVEPELNAGNQNMIEIVTPEPNREELLSEFARKRCMDMLISQKIDNILQPIVNDRDTIISTAKAQSNDLIAKKIEQAIPISLSKGMSGTLVPEAMLTIHIAVKAYIQASSRPSRMVLKTFEPLDLAIKSAISNFQAEHQAKSNCWLMNI